MFTSNTRMRENVNLRDCGMIVDARWAGVCVSETADLLGFSHTTVSGVFALNGGGEEKKTENIQRVALLQTEALC